MSSISNTEPSVLAIIGSGPTCTYAVERLAASFSHHRDRLKPCTIYVFEKTGHFGAGEVHSPAQPHTSFLNRIAGQVCFAADESNVDAGPLLPPPLRPTLHLWCQRKYQETRDEKYNIGPNDWPHRALHGEALTDVFHRYIDLLRQLDNVKINLVQAEVIDIEKSGNRFRVISSGHREVVCDHLLLTTGHSSNCPSHSPRAKILADHGDAHPGLRFVNYAYPLEEKLKDISSSTTVAVQGLGLTAIDVFLHLTEGSGGQFVWNSDETCVYIPSGREPKLIGFSRSGLFTSARPHNEKEADIEKLEHKGTFFTNIAVDRLRAHRGIGEGRKLDFELQLWPIIRLEQAHLYYATLYGRVFGAYLAERITPHYVDFLEGRSWFASDSEKAIEFFESHIEKDVDALNSIVDAVLSGNYRQSGAIPDHIVGSAVAHFLKFFSGLDFDPDGDLRSASYASEFEQLRSPWRHSRALADHKYSWDSICRPISGLRSGPEYTKALIEFMEHDHRQARQNNLQNPFKALCDGVWRDLRQVLAYAIDDGGLTPDSHRLFLTQYMRIHNRLGNGASLGVMEKILALIKAGALDVSLGSNPEVLLSEGDAPGFILCSSDKSVRFESQVLINAKIHEFAALEDVRPLYRNMHRRGLIRIWENTSELGPSFRPGGIELNETFNPVDGNGVTLKNITLLGPPTEGKFFFQIGAARPAQNHHVINDVICWASSFMAHLIASPAENSEDIEGVHIAQL